MTFSRLPEAWGWIQSGLCEVGALSHKQGDLSRVELQEAVSKIVTVSKLVQRVALFCEVPPDIS